jgi:hypothetical protein
MTITKVLIDVGAGLNIRFLETLRKMGLDFGIVPRKAAMPLGQITLPITFGTPTN